MTITLTGLVMLVVYLIVAGLVLWLLRYLIGVIPMQEPFKKVADTLIIVIGVLILIVLLLNFAGVISVR